MQELIFGRSLYPAARWRADAVALREDGFTSTFAEHISRVERAARSITSLVGNSQERFAVLSLNSHEYVELWHAAMLGGGVIVPLNYRLSAAEVAGLVADSGARVVFVDEASRALWQEASELIRDSGIQVVGLRWSADGVPDYESLIASEADGRLPEPDETDLLSLMYTGGTTGRAKGVMTSHRNAVLNMYHQMDVHRPGAQTVYLHQSPIFHAAAMWGLMGPTAGGGQQVVLSKFTPTAVVETVERYGVTDTQMGPTMVGMLLDECGDQIGRIGSLRQLVYGTAPMPQGTIDRLVRDLPELSLLHGYGMTESTSAVSFLRWDELLADRSLIPTAGRPLTGVTVTIQDAAGETLPPNTDGEICVRAGNVADGYWNRPDETAAAFRDGWYRTGDLGRMDERGYLTIVDRIKDMIISGGENVYSVEVESAISTHPGVAQVAVVGVPHEKWGEQVHAVVVPHEGVELDEADLEKHTRTQIAGYKVPKAWTIRTDPLPVSGAMKILKRDIRASLRCRRP